MIIYTSICLNYLPKALALGYSIKKTNSQYKYYIILLEREFPEEISDDVYQYVDKIILAKNIGFNNFDKFIFKHSIVEASTSVKGQALEYLLTNVDDKVVYIDPDIYLYDSLDDLESMLDENDIILTPHLTIPEQNENDIQNNELCALQHGVYNLGFVAVRNGDEGLRFAKWWNSRLQLYCYDDIPRGIFTDQRWCDLAPAYFDVKILKNPGYNMAPWNLTTRILSERQGRYFVNQKYPLIFFHYSGFDSGANETVFNYYVPDKSNCIYELRDRYVQIMNDFGQAAIGKSEWTYNIYSSGEKIDNQARKIYREKKLWNVVNDNPFELNNDFFIQY